jgi:hypothetical protein
MQLISEKTIALQPWNVDNIVAGILIHAVKTFIHMQNKN